MVSTPVGAGALDPSRQISGVLPTPQLLFRLPSLLPSNQHHTAEDAGAQVCLTGPASAWFQL